MALLKANTRIYGNTIIDSNLFVGNSNVFVSSSNTSGTLIVRGGIGATGNIYVGNVVITGGASNGLFFRDGTAQLTTATAISQSAFNSANAGVTLATAAYAQANNASGNTVALQTQMTTTNTNITSVNVFAQAAFAKANDSVQSVSGTSGRISVSPTTGSVIVDLNTVGTILAGTYSYPQLDVDSYGRITLISNQTPVTSFNGMTGAVTLSSANVTTALGYTPLSTTQGSDINTFAASAFASANAGVDLAIAAYGEANTQNTINGTQNTSITAINTLATAAYGEANAATSINSTQNTNITSINTLAGSSFNTANAALALAQAAYGQANAESSINSTQNTNITAVNTFAQAAYNQANTGGAPTTIGIQTNASYFPIFVNSNNATATAETLNSHANLTYNPSTGTLSATIFSATSDQSLKENVKTIENPINIVKQLRGVSYTWIKTKEESIGLIAQEVEKVLPSVVRQNEDKKTVDYQNIIGLLVEAIKELNEKIERLEGKQ